MKSIVLGLVLGFASTDGQRLELTVTLTEPATVSLSWGEITRSSTGAMERHRFGDLPIKEGAPLRYRIEVANEEPKEAELPAISRDAKLRIAMYGDSRDGSGPHELLARAIAASKPSVVLHTGDVVATATDDQGWLAHLGATRELAPFAPAILALGNHDLYLPVQARGPGESSIVARAAARWPTPIDPLALEHKAPRAAHRVFVGPALFIVLDSNAPLAVGSPQRAFLEAALADRKDARFVFVAMHHGPISAGPHGGLPDGADLPELFAGRGVTAVISGHDHTYQRIERDGVTYLVSGGGGAPLYEKSRAVLGLRTFASTYHWVQVDLDRDRCELRVYALEGALLDRIELPAKKGERGDRDPSWDLRLAMASVLLGLAAAGMFGARIMRD
jgi:acid phosphatase type 7